MSSLDGRLRTSASKRWTGLDQTLEEGGGGFVQRSEEDWICRLDHRNYRITRPPVSHGEIRSLRQGTTESSATERARKELSPEKDRIKPFFECDLLALALYFSLTL